MRSAGHLPVERDRQLLDLLAQAIPAGPWSSVTAGHPLTVADIRRAMDDLRNRPYTRCVGSNQHVVHPVVAARGGWARCANCFNMINLGAR